MAGLLSGDVAAMKAHVTVARSGPESARRRDGAGRGAASIAHRSLRPAPPVSPAVHALDHASSVPPAHDRVRRDLPAHDPAVFGGGAVEARRSPRADGEESPWPVPPIQRRSLPAAASDASAATVPDGGPGHAGLPDHLRSGIENLSGQPMDHVRVHFNSPRPMRLNAQAYAQGSDIYLGPGQQRHLPHEAWHVVQQMQGRVRPTLRIGGAEINDDAALEREAEAMGRSASQPAHSAATAETLASSRASSAGKGPPAFRAAGSGTIAQRVVIAQIVPDREQKVVAAAKTDVEEKVDPATSMDVEKSSSAPAPESRLSGQIRKSSNDAEMAPDSKKAKVGLAELSQKKMGLAEKLSQKIKTVRIKGRPRHIFGSSMGDHTTAFVVHVHAVKSRVEGKTVGEAFKAVSELFDDAKTLPGYKAVKALGGLKPAEREAELKLNPNLARIYRLLKGETNPGTPTGAEGKAEVTGTPEGVKDKDDESIGTPTGAEGKAEVTGTAEAVEDEDDVMLVTPEGAEGRVEHIIASFEKMRDQKDVQPALLLQDLMAAYLEFRECIPLSGINVRDVSSTGGKGHGEKGALKELAKENPEDPSWLKLFDTRGIGYALAVLSERDADQLAPGLWQSLQLPKSLGENAINAARAFVDQHIGSIPEVDVAKVRTKLLREVLKAAASRVLQDQLHASRRSLKSAEEWYKSVNSEVTEFDLPKGEKGQRSRSKDKVAMDVASRAARESVRYKNAKSASDSRDELLAHFKAEYNAITRSDLHVVVNEKTHTFDEIYAGNVLKRHQRAIEDAQVGSLALLQRRLLLHQDFQKAYSNYIKEVFPNKADEIGETVTKLNASRPQRQRHAPQKEQEATKKTTPTPTSTTSTQAAQPDAGKQSESLAVALTMPPEGGILVTSAGRPKSQVQGGEGAHTTAWVVIVDAVAKTLEKASLDDAQDLMSGLYDEATQFKDEADKFETIHTSFLKSNIVELRKAAADDLAAKKEQFKSDKDALSLQDYISSFLKYVNLTPGTAVGGESLSRNEAGARKTMKGNSTPAEREEAAAMLFDRPKASKSMGSKDLEKLIARHAAWIKRAYPESEQSKDD
jgi:hypothetical protein